MTVDIDNDDLNSLMAELEAQNANLFKTDVAAPKPEPTPEPVAVKETVPENEHWQAGSSTPPAPEVIHPSTDDEPFDVDADLALLEELEANAPSMAPTQVDKLNAEQQVGLEVAFEPKVEVQSDIQPAAPVATQPPPDAEVAPAAEDIAVDEPKVDVETALLPDLEPETLPEIEAKPREVDAPKVSAAARKEAAKLSLKPDLQGFMRETRVTEATLQECMYDQSGLMAYYVAKNAEAERQLARTKQQFNTLEARLYDAYRKKFLKEGEKATEKAIENAVRMDQQWVDKYLELIDAQAIADTHKGFVNAMHDRRAMLIQLGSDRREEMKGTMRIREAVSDPTAPAAVQRRAEDMTMAEKAVAAAKRAMERHAA